ncbi:hypothetical protein, partial [Cryobacterium frigoriphilum]|uniref:hypothetical protein n=1 Tax=Cryobacterium frigoriphilum TaxID=1259150 RepID=UPI001A7EDC1D
LARSGPHRVTDAPPRARASVTAYHSTELDHFLGENRPRGPLNPLNSVEWYAASAGAEVTERERFAYLMAGTSPDHIAAPKRVPAEMPTGRSRLYARH